MKYCIAFLCAVFASGVLSAKITDFDLQTFVDREIATGEKTVIVPPGRYRVHPRNGRHLVLNGVTNVTLVAKGVEMICADLVNALVITNCSNVTVRGLTVDYDPLPFTEGRITAVSADHKTLDVELFEGYPDTSEISLFKCQFFRPDTKWLRTAQGASAFKVLGKRKLQLTWPGGKSPSAPQVGDIMVTNIRCIPFGELVRQVDTYAQARHAVLQKDSVHTRFEHVTVYASQWFAFYEKDCDGTVYDHCTVDRRPEADDFMRRGYPRLRAANADAFHNRRPAKGPTFLSCTAKFMEDDGVNIHGDYHLVSASQGAELRVFSQDTMNIVAGDPVELLTPDGTRMTDVHAASVMPASPSVMTAEETAWLRKLNFRPYFRDYWTPKVYRIALDRSISLPRGSVIVSLKRAGHGFLIKDCTLGYTRARGILLRASDGRVENNTITETGLPGILLTSEAWWLEGGNPDNVVITGNTFSNIKSRAILLDGTGGLAGGKGKTGISKNIEIMNNRISDAQIPAIQAYFVSTLSLHDNTFYVDAMPDPKLSFVSFPGSKNVMQAYNRFYLRKKKPSPAIPAGTAASLSKKTYTCYRSFWPELAMTRTFADMGITTRCFFAANAINSIGFEYCKYPLIWTGIKKYNFAAFDNQVDDLLKASPHANFLCMIDLNTPYWLTRRYALDSYADISHAAANMDWMRITTEWMKDFIAYAEKKYGDKITAYILSGGGTSEWYEYDRGRTSRDKNQAWVRWCRGNGLNFKDVVPPETELFRARHENVIYDPAYEGEKIAYWQFHNEIIADALLEFAKQARTVIPKHKEIGSFFGYYLVSDNRLLSFGHMDYERVFASPDIDFFIAPGTYTDRMPGGGSGSQLVHGTTLRYGKQFLHEIDYRTHTVSLDYWKTTEDDIAGNTREAAFALINHTSLWWFDMWGGFYKEAQTRERIRQMTRLSERFQNDRSESVAEVLYVADPQSAYYVNERSPQSPAMSQCFRNKLNRIGTPFDCYSFNDLSVINLSRYKVICLPGTFLITPEREKILREKVLKDNRTVVWCYAPGICDGATLNTGNVKKWAGVDYRTQGISTTKREGWTSVYAFSYDLLTPKALQNICRTAGVHLYTDDLVPVYANRRLLCVHLRDGGEKTIRLPEKAGKIVSLLDNQTVGEKTDRFTVSFRSPDTKLFEIHP